MARLVDGGLGKHVLNELSPLLKSLLPDPNTCSVIGHSLVLNPGTGSVRKDRTTTLANLIVFLLHYTIWCPATQSSSMRSCQEDASHTKFEYIWNPFNAKIVARLCEYIRIFLLCRTSSTPVGALATWQRLLI